MFFKFFLNITKNNYFTLYLQGVDKGLKILYNTN